MRYSEICEGCQQQNPTLQSLNKIKKRLQNDAENDAIQNGLIGAMYGDTTGKQAWLDIERAELEIARQRQELAADTDDNEALADMVQAGLKRRQRHRQAIERAALKTTKNRLQNRLYR